jgi:L-iditol 2-dehydrogenase
VKAFTCTEDGALRLLSRDKPRLHPDTVLLRVLLTAICGTDLRTYRHGSQRIRPPRVIGHEACGLVEEVGSAVGSEIGSPLRGLRPGQRVVVAPAVGCGECRWCRAGSTNLCDRLRTVGFDFDGTFAEYLEVPAAALAQGHLLEVADSLATEQAVLAEPAACCLNGQEYLRIGPEDTVFIFGAGFIGCVHAELALRRGAARVILGDVSQARLEAARALLPSLETVNTAAVDAPGFVRERTDGRGADVIITACPAGEAHAAALKLAAARARISLFGGIPGEGRGFLDSNAIHYRELSIYGSHASTAAQNRQVLEWLSAGELDLAKYVSATFALSDIVEAFEALRSEKVLKVLIRP